jgi:hypothetical protein
MQVTKNITLDLLETGSPVIIKAKQNDRNTRYIAAHLYVGRLDYQVPSGTEIAFRYKKPDGTAGFYDALPDNSPAITVSGNTVTVELVEQVLTAAGCVHCEINMYNAASEKLTTFTFEISVEESVLTDAEIISSDYYNVLTAEIAKALRAVTDATEQAENAAQSAQDAADNAAMSKDWAAGQPVTYNGTPVSIAYAGANRIASITAYGETPQGGTTEAPVALTGVDSVHVCGRNLLPLPHSQVSETKNGLNIAVNADGTITVSGTATAETYLNLNHIPASLYRLIGLTGIVPAYDYPVTKNGFTFFDLTIQPYGEFARVYIVITKGSVVNRTYHPYIIKSAEPLPYETYQGSVTPLPIPRPLHKVGDVRDVCRTRVKSVYDKRIIIDQNSDISMSGEGSIIGTSHRFNLLRTDLPPVNVAVRGDIGCDKLPTLPSGGAGGTYALDVPGISVQNDSSVEAINFRVPGCKTLEEIKAWLTDNPLTVYYQSTAYDGANGLDVCLTEYMTGYIESYADESITTAWISSTGELSTGAEVAYVLSSPETYATDPLDFDNAAGPLTVMTGGELEVRMTELIGSRSDVSNNTVAFSEASQDADIASGEKLSVLFGKIKKRFSVLASTVMLKSVFTQVGNPNLLDNSNFTNPVNQRGVGSYTDTWKYCIDRWTLIGKYDVKAHTLTFQADNAIERFGLTLSYMRQGIEGLNIGDKVTLSASAGGVAYSHTITLAADMQQAYNKGPFLFTVEYYSSTNVAWFGIGITSGSVAIEWIKAEKGGITTPYVPKEYGAELAECQRYYLRIPNWQMVGSGYVDWEGKHIFIMMPTPSTMRIAPTAVAISGTAYCGDGTTSAYSGTPGAINRPGWVVLDLSGTFTQKNQTATFVMGNTPLELSSDL